MAQRGRQQWKKTWYFLWLCSPPLMVHCSDTLSTGHQRQHSQSLKKSQLYILMFIITSLQRREITQFRLCPGLTLCLKMEMKTKQKNNGGHNPGCRKLTLDTGFYKINVILSWKGSEGSELCWDTVCVCVCIRMYVHTYIHICINIYVDTHTVCIYVHTNICIYVYTHTYTCKYKQV